MARASRPGDSTANLPRSQQKTPNLGLTFSQRIAYIFFCSHENVCPLYLSICVAKEILFNVKRATYSGEYRNAKMLFVKKYSLVIILLFYSTLLNDIFGEIQ